MKITLPENHMNSKSAQKTEPISGRLNERLDKLITVVHSFQREEIELCNRIQFEYVFCLGIKLGETFGLRIPDTTA